MSLTKITNSRGVSLLFIVLIMSVILAVGLGVSGILIQQTKISEEIGDSVVSFYAADTGVEQELYDLYKLPEDNHLSSYVGTLNVMSNSVSYDVAAKCSTTTDCFVGFPVDETCGGLNFCIKSVGSYQKTKRAIEIKY